MKTIIPFQGFYCSLHDSILDNALELLAQDDSGDIDQDKHDKMFDAVNWRKVWVEYAKEYCYQLSQLIDIDLKFEELSSPKFYNYSTDRIFADISESDVLKMFDVVDKTKLNQMIKDNFTSCDGFISNYPNSLDDWDSDVTTWDHNQVGTLLSCYIDIEHDLKDIDYQISDRMDDAPYRFISNNYIEINE